MEINEEKASAGHKLGQLIGDWLEQFPVLASWSAEVAKVILPFFRYAFHSPSDPRPQDHMERRTRHCC